MKRLTATLKHESWELLKEYKFLTDIEYSKTVNNLILDYLPNMIDEAKKRKESRKKE